MIKGATATLGLAAMLLALAVPSAQALTRPEYVTQADAICKADFKALNKPVKKAARKFKRSTRGADHRMKIRAAFRFFGTLDVLTGKAYSRATADLSALVPPPEDAAVIAQWLQSRHPIAKDLLAAGKAAKAQKLKPFKRISKQLFAELKASDQIVAGFGFRSCARQAQSAPAI